MSNYRDTLEHYLSQLDIKADRVLDVGGAAKPVKDRVRSWDVKKYKIADNGLENSQDSATIDIQLDLNEKYISDEGDDGLNNLGKFDVMFCLEVMEYICNPSVAIENLAWRCSTNGILYITFPFLYPAHEPFKNDYLRYTAQGVARLLGEANFKILDMANRVMKPESFIYYKQFMKSEGFHASKHCRHDLLGWIVMAEKQ